MLAGEEAFELQKTSKPYEPSVLQADVPVFYSEQTRQA
jgi:hypothetical protein